jgi:hypothetical protein
MLLRGVVDKRSGIESNPNHLDDPEYIVRLMKQVVTVSAKTVQLMRDLSQAVIAQNGVASNPQQVISFYPYQAHRV